MPRRRGGMPPRIELARDKAWLRVAGPPCAGSHQEPADGKDWDGSYWSVATFGKCRYSFPCFVGGAPQECEELEPDGMPPGPRTLSFTQLWDKGRGLRAALHRTPLPDKLRMSQLALDAKQCVRLVVAARWGIVGLSVVVNQADFRCWSTARLRRLENLFSCALGFLDLAAEERGKMSGELEERMDEFGFDRSAPNPVDAATHWLERAGAAAEGHRSPLAQWRYLVWKALQDRAQVLTWQVIRSQGKRGRFRRGLGWSRGP